MSSNSELLSLLNGINQDFHMLKDQTWVPDTDSCEASIDAVERIADILMITLDDVEDNEL
jgi:hypothetical protein